MSAETKVQPTASPWTVWAPDEDSLEGQYEIVSEYFADGSKRFVVEMVAECCGEAQEADARLIAAAPELLEALRRCERRLRFLEDVGEDLDTPETRSARAAIAKAEGR